MFFYKLQKIFKKSFKNLLISALSLSALASFGSFAGIFFSIYSDDFAKSEKKYLVLFSMLFTSINFFSIYLVDSYLSLNVILSIFLGYLISFLFFFIPSLIFTIFIEYTEVSLEPEEIREAKLNKVLRRYF